MPRARNCESMSDKGCFRAFKQNHWLGFAVFAGIALDAMLRGA